MLTIEGLSKYYGKKEVLKNVSFFLQPGKVTGLVGPNGAGKTTIMKSILGLVQYQKGDIRIGSHRISPFRRQGLEKVGALVEKPGIYPFLTGMDHLKLFSETKDPADLSTIIAKLKMEEYVHKKTKTYSLGMKQKLGLALALLNHPKIIILDEPMNGLDPQSIKDVREIILALVKQGISFLISSHLLSELEKMADEIIVIDHGKVIQQCTMTEIAHQLKRYVVLSTSDDSLAKKLLTKSGVFVEPGPSIKLVKENNEQLGKVIQQLAAHDIQVHDLQHSKNDLEAFLLKLLNH